MKIFLLKNVAQVGKAGEVVTVAEGFAMNFLFPQKLAVKATKENELLFENNKKKNIKEELASQEKTSILSEKIKDIQLVLKRKMHDDGKLYNAVTAVEITELLAKEGIIVSKSSIEFDKSIKTKGSFEFTVKLTSKLKSKANVKIVADTNVL